MEYLKRQLALAYADITMGNLVPCVIILVYRLKFNYVNQINFISKHRYIHFMNAVQNIMLFPFKNILTNRLF